MPGIFSDFISSLANAIETSESLALMTTLGIISTAIAKYFKVSPAEGWQEPINIYTLIALPPANHKSYILNMCTKPLIVWEKEQAASLENKIKYIHSERKTQEKIIDSM